MIIDIVVHYLGGKGGTESVLALVYEELKKRNYRVRIVQYYSCEDDKWTRNIDEVYSLFKSNGENLINPEEFVKAYSEFMNINGKADVVVATHIPIMSFLCKRMVCEYDKNICVLSWLHNPVNVFGFQEGIVYADAHLAISNSVAKGISKIDKKKNIYVINNPVDINNDFVKRNKEKLQLLYVGRLENSQKRIDTILKAVSRLKGEWNLNLIGDGPHKNMLQQFSVEQGISEKIIWSGWKEEPWKEVKEGSLLLLTSSYEGFGLVIVEALSRGIPVIATKTGIATDLIKQGENGWLIDVNDYESLATIINDIQDGRRSLPSKECCRKSVERFDKRLVTNELEKAVLIEYSKKKFKRG